MANKIKRNRSDAEMLKGFVEEETFEHADRSAAAPPRGGKKQSQGGAGYLTEEAEAKLERALLELKVRMFREGILDYDFNVAGEGNRVILTAVPKKKKSSQ